MRRCWVYDARAPLIALLILAGTQAILAQESTRPVSPMPPPFNPEHGVVVPPHWAKELLAQCSRPSITVEGTWMPSEEHIRELERRLAFELDEALKPWHPRLQEAMQMRLQAGNYYRQYVGIVVSGRRLIYVNGFRRQAVENEDPLAWKARPVVVCDGGVGFWHAAYDPERRTFVVFKFGDGPGQTVVFNGVA